MTDPVTFEIIKHRLWQINDEQGIAIKTISASPIVVEGNDFNVGLFTRDAELVTAGIGESGSRYDDGRCALLHYLRTGRVSRTAISS